MSFGKACWNIIEAITRFFLLKVFRLKLSEEQVQAFLQFVRFGLVGLSSTVIAYGIFVVSLFLLQHFHVFPHYDYLVAQFISFALSVLWSFIWNNRFVFKEQEGESRNLWRTLLKTYVSYSFTGLFLSSALSYLWVDVIGIPKLYAPIINLLFTVPLNFFINKFWAYRTKKAM